MSSRLRNISFDCADTYDLSGFWSEVLGYPRHPDDHPGDPEAVLLPPDEVGPMVFFQAVPEGKFGEPRTGFMSLVGAGPGTRRCALSAVARSGSSRGWLTFL